MAFALDDQIAAQPAAVRRVLAQRDTPPLDPARPLIFTGIGTSLHAARVAARWTVELTGGALRPAALDAHDLGLTLPVTASDQVVVISHRGTKRYPSAALRRARAAGAATIAIVGEDAPQPDADHVMRTCPNERAGTHTVSYLTALAALGRLIAPLGGAMAPAFEHALAAVPSALEATLAASAPVAVAARLAQCEPLMITGFDLDAITADEAALKIKEGAYLWAEGLSTEFALHGPPAAFRPGMGAITITPGTDDGGRTAQLRALLDALGAVAVACGDGAEELRFAPVEPQMRPFATIVPLQRLTAELARLRGANPDVVHRDVEPWTSAMGRIAL